MKTVNIVTVEFCFDYDTKHKLKLVKLLV